MGRKTYVELSAIRFVAFNETIQVTDLTFPLMWTRESHYSSGKGLLLPPNNPAGKHFEGFN